MPFDGFVSVDDNASIPFSFKNGKLKLYFGNRLCAIEREITELISYNIDNPSGCSTLFHLSVPLSADTLGINNNKSSGCLFANIELDVDYYVENYHSGSKYTKMKFAFEELDYFIPSCGKCIRNAEDNSIVFSDDIKEIIRFPFLFKGKNINLVLRTFSMSTFGHSSCVNTASDLTLEFDETNDVSFIFELYRIIFNFFSFICNRRNISIKNAKLVGKRIEELPKCVVDGKVILEKKCVTDDEYFYVIDNYSSEFEDTKTIAKTINYGYIAPHFKELIELIKDSKVSIFSIHSCNKDKNLIDLDQSLHITAAFEYYQRTFLPKISSDSTIEFYNDIKELILEYSERESGTKKKKAKEFIKHLSPVISLKEKIKKVYDGYSSWGGLGDILDEWFNGKVEDLAEVANDWRNELAHEKNEYQPDIRVVKAIRLVEHINYCIVLRQANYSDDEIKNIVAQILKH